MTTEWVFVIMFLPQFVLIQPALFTSQSQLGSRYSGLWLSICLGRCNRWGVVSAFFFSTKKCRTFQYLRQASVVGLLLPGSFGFVGTTQCRRLISLVAFNACISACQKCGRWPQALALLRDLEAWSCWGEDKIRLQSGKNRRGNIPGCGI